MLHCRKIYCNLLLLSLLLFALGATATPRIALHYTGVPAWNIPSERFDFRWECTSGGVVYRGQQITATVGNELDFTVPEQNAELVVPRDGFFALNNTLQRHPECRYRLHISRAPPQAG